MRKRLEIKRTLDEAVNLVRDRVFSSFKEAGEG